MYKHYYKIITKKLSMVNMQYELRNLFVKKLSSYLECLNSLCVNVPLWIERVFLENSSCNSCNTYQIILNALQTSQHLFLKCSIEFKVVLSKILKFIIFLKLIKCRIKSKFEYLQKRCGRPPLTNTEFDNYIYSELRLHV